MVINNKTQPMDIDECRSIAAIAEPEYKLSVSSDGISVLLDCPTPLDNLESTVERIEKDFQSMELPEYPDRKILSKILESSCEPGQSVISLTLMKGWPATPSKDGKLEWGRDFFNEESGPVDDEEALDFWDHHDNQSVEGNELLARVFHAVSGEPGLDVFSREIPVNKPNVIKLRSGKGVRQIDEGQWLAYYAETPGRIRYQDDTLVVDDVFLIKGDVSLETGNIKHTGMVQIEGDVKTGATIQADGDILVKGMLDPCNIVCGGSLTVMGGIVGQDDYLIEVAGALKATYIGGAFIRCGGDVIIANEIANAEVKACGKVLVSTGRIAGGEVIGREGIVVAEAGGSGATKTLLVVGVDFTAEARIAEHENNLIQLEEAQDKIHEVLEKIGMSEDEASDNPKLCDLYSKSKQIGEAIIKEHGAIRLERQKSRQASKEEVLMLKEVWSGTTIQIGEFKMVVRTSIDKSRVARLNDKKVSILPAAESDPTVS